MGTVYYGLAGEGHGHAARATPIIEHLRQRHRVVVLTFDKALSMLRPRYQGSNVEVRQIPGMQLQYGAFNRMSPTKTIMRGIPEFMRVDQRAKALAEEVARDASLVISDFEPISLRAAALGGVTSVSIDHQRFLQACSFDSLHWNSCWKISGMAAIIDRVYGKPQRMIISGFYLPRLRPAYSHAHTVGALIRRQIEEATPSDGEHLLVYVRRQCPPSVHRALADSPIPVRLYGMGEREPDGAICYRPVSNDGFIDDLASCRAVLTTAGNQLIGEAFVLGKPVLAFPEPGNFEQHINAHLLSLSGGGKATSHRFFDRSVLTDFLDQVPTYHERLQVIGKGGNAQVFEIVDQLLAHAPAPQRSGQRSFGSVLSGSGRQTVASIRQAGAGTPSGA